jgi:hypothetical protein
VPPALIELWKKDLPTATVRLYEGLGHVAMEELPDATARDAHEFLSAAVAAGETESRAAGS